MAEQIKYYKHSYLALFSLKSNNYIFEKKTLFWGTFSKKIWLSPFQILQLSKTFFIFYLGILVCQLKSQYSEAAA